MKTARVVAIKKSGESTDMNNYRLIPILQAINKYMKNHAYTNILLLV